MSGASLLMSKVINIGVMGCANIADRHLIPALKAMPKEFNLLAISSRDGKKAADYGNKFEVKSVVGYDQLLQIKEIEAVYIPLPNSLHYEWVKKSLRKGKHVLVEKSLACNFDEVEELLSIAKDRGLVLLENFQFRFHSQLNVIKDLIAIEKIGELRNVKSSFGFPPFPDSNNIRYSKELGGGSLLDAGAYPLKISQELLGQKIFVDSATLSFCPERKVDIWGNAQLKDLNSSIVSQVAFGFDNFYQCSLEVWGSKGIIKTGRVFTCPPGAEATIEIINSSGAELITVVPDNHFENMLNYFYELINKRLPVEEEYLSALHQARLIRELVEQSHEK
jgi:NDP-hexose-3-ketoreductase